MKIRIFKYFLKILVLSLPFYQAFKLLHSNTDPDPRDHQKISDLVSLRESNSFKNDLQGKTFRKFFFPGLKAAQLSFTWLETLQGLHNPASYERDYSWLFSKLHTFAVYSNASEYRRILAITPVLYVVGKDPIGSTILMNELIHRAQKLFTPWYWGGYHAIENLKDRRLAAEMFYQCSQRQGAPIFVASLANRLGHRESSALNTEEKESFKAQLHPELKKTLKQ